MPTYYTQTCIQCGNDFTWTRRSVSPKHCSPKCVGLTSRKPFLERFWERVPNLGDDECWEFESRSLNRYGIIEDCGIQYLAHRVSLEIALGRPLLDGAVVMHSCDNPPCVNPRHLSEGSVKENTRDASAKGRLARGERNRNSKINESIVREILDRRARGEKQLDIANYFGISQVLVSMVCLNKIWKHVPR